MTARLSHLCRIWQSLGSVLVTELQIILGVKLLCSNSSDNSQLAQQHLSSIFNIIILMEQSDVFLQLLQAVASVTKPERSKMTQRDCCCRMANAATAEQTREDI